MPFLSRISLYPIKSLSPYSPTEATFLPSGALKYDREHAIFDTEGKVMNGKRTPLVHGLKTSYEISSDGICAAVKSAHSAQKFALPSQITHLESWLSSYFERDVVLEKNEAMGFPDDKKALGPTVISTATLKVVAAWFPGMTLENARIRFRSNLEIGGVPPFWEDQLYGEVDQPRLFQIGNARIWGTNPCQRCVVPPRDPETGETIEEFSQIFRRQREAYLPAWATQSRFNHFYRLAVNTCVEESESGKVIRVGDEVHIIE